MEQPRTALPPSSSVSFAIPRKPVTTMSQHEIQSSPVPTKSSRHIHPLIPSSMIGALILGVAFAIGHNFFYHHFNGRPVESVNQQAWVLRGGTAFAFVVKMFLAIATAAAYVQYCWLSLRNHVQTVQDIDSLTAILGNVALFFKVGLWVKRPLLAVIAGITWSLPIAALITPGTITVKAVLTSPVVSGLVPQLEYDMTAYASSGCDRDGGCTYAGPKSAVSQTVIAAAMQNSIVQITPPFSNASYSLRFAGPSLSCQYEDSTAATSYFDQQIENESGELQYLSWVPSSSYPNITTFPQNLYNPFENVSLTWEQTTLDLISQDTARINVLAQSGFVNVTYNYTLMQCSLYNASYEVDFNFTYPEQHIVVVNKRFLNNVSASRDVPNTEPGYGNFTQSVLSMPSISYQAIMDAFGRVMVGQTVTPYLGGQTTTASLFPMTAAFSMVGQPPGLIAATVEEMFQNMTLSMLASSSLTKNTTTNSPINITTNTYQQHYIYSPKDLYIAYGIAILFSSLCVTLGLFALNANGAGYRFDFSTILRTTRSHDFDALVADADFQGGAPLPSRLGEQKVRFRDHPADRDGRTEPGGFAPAGDASEPLIRQRRKYARVAGGDDGSGFHRN